MTQFAKDAQLLVVKLTNWSQTNFLKIIQEIGSNIASLFRLSIGADEKGRGEILEETGTGPYLYI